MKVYLLVIVAMALIAPGTPMARELPPCDLNLVRNPGCEESLVADEIPHWTQVGAGGWSCRSASPSPASGAAYFAAGEGDTPELFQDVDVTAYQTIPWAVRFSGVIRTADEAPSDQAGLLFEFRGQGGVLGQVDFGAQASPSTWTQLFLCCEGFPAGTDVVRVRLLGTRLQGAQADAWFDSIEIVPLCPLQSTPEVWGRLKSLYRE